MWKFKLILYIFLVVAVLAISAEAQSSSFTYQGKLTDNGLAANGDYEMQFALYDGNGNQVSVTLTYTNVVVNNGIFTAQLSFGATVFDGNPRFLQIGVRPSGSANPYTLLSPRQAVQSSPYSIRSLNSALADNSNQLGGIPSNLYVLTTDSRLTDARNPLANSPNYIQNSNIQQISSNFNISGNGTLGGLLSANTVNSTTQFNIGGNRVFSNAGTNNLFAGVGAGASNSTGNGNAFFGALSGDSNTNGVNNSFFGFNAGSGNNGGGANTFIGVNSGIANIGSSNNTFIGANVANTNLTGNGNTYIGANSDGAALITNSVAIGQKAYVGQSNALILGSINGVNGATADMNVGIGTTTPATKLYVKDTGDNTLSVESTSVNGASLQLFNNNGSNARHWLINSNYSLTFFDMDAPSANRMKFRISTPALGIGITNNTFGDFRGDFSVLGRVQVGLLTGTGYNLSNLCVDLNGTLELCSSSLRYKKDINHYTGGLTVLNRLNPITFRWKADNIEDLGFGAEDVEKVEPLLVSYNKEGEIQGVKYERITTVLVNSVKEQQQIIENQQRQIDEQQKHIELQQKQFDELKSVVCSIKPDAMVCKEKDSQ